MKKNNDKKFKLAIVLFIFAIVMGFISRLYQGFIFNPKFHGGFWSACKVLFSWEQAKAYFHDPIGILLFLLMIIPAIAGFIIVFFYVYQTEQK